MRKVREFIDKYDWGTLQVLWDDFTFALGLGGMGYFLWLFFDKLFS